MAEERDDREGTSPTDSGSPDGDGGASPDDTEDSPGGWRAFERRYDAEPDEFDPDELAPEIPEAPDPSEVDVDEELQRRFWGLVVVFNAALLLASVGVMFVAFQGQWNLGSRLTLLGALLFAYGFYRYRKTTAALGDGSGEDGNGEADAGGPDGDPEPETDSDDPDGDPDPDPEGEDGDRNG